jgi:hypothetical protein
LELDKPIFFSFFIERFGDKLPLFFFILGEHTYTIYIYNSLRTASCCCLHRFRSVENILWGAEPRFELGPALQQADALLIVPRRTLLCHAAPCCATPHPIVPRRTLNLLAPFRID